MLEYWRERLPLHVFGPVAVALTVPAHLTVPFEAVAVAIDTAFAFLLLAQFRLWDDLVDRRVDAVRHPERVLVRASNTTTYVVACIALGVLNALIVLQRSGAHSALPLLGALTVVLICAYGQPPKSAARDLLRLAKYPVFVLVLAVGRPGASLRVAVYSAVAAFAAAVAYEVHHDHSAALLGFFGGTHESE